MAVPTVLLVTKNSTMVEAVQGVLVAASHVNLEVYPLGEDAREEVKRENVVLVLVDPEAAGGDPGVTQLLWAIAATRRPCPTLVLTTRYTEHQAFTLLRAGAADYLEIPADRDKLAQLVKALDARAGGILHPRNRSTAIGREPVQDLVTEGMEDRLDQIRRVAALDSTVLLVGEAGTGKKGLARLIHELSPRRAAPFLVVDCAALSSGVIESEFFGHVKGAFTGADRDRPGKLAAAGGETAWDLQHINGLECTIFQGSMQLTTFAGRPANQSGREKGQ